LQERLLRQKKRNKTYKHTHDVMEERNESKEYVSIEYGGRLYILVLYTDLLCNGPTHALFRLG